MLRIEKKQDVSALRSTLVRAAAVIAALLASCAVIALFGNNPIEVFVQIFKGATGTERRIISTINKIIPLVILSLGVSVAFKMKFWNIGAEGQLYMGAFAAAVVAFSYPDMSKPLLLLLMLAAGFIAGGLWAVVPALLKVKWGASETLVTLMLNYVAVKFISFLETGPWRDPKAMGQAKIANFSENALLPKIFGIHIGWIFAVIMLIVIYILFKKTKLGYEISVLGENIQTARYAGINVTKTIVVSVILSGGLCGAVGMIQASGFESSINSIMSNNYGFTAIIIAWLARLSPPGILIVSTLFSMLLQGGSYIQLSMNIPSALAEVIQGVILFFVLASEFFTSYRVKRIKNTHKKGVPENE